MDNLPANFGLNAPCCMRVKLRHRTDNADVAKRSNRSVTGPRVGRYEMSHITVTSKCGNYWHCGGQFI